MENNQPGLNKTGTPTNQRPNEAPDRQQPEEKAPAIKKAEIDPEVPNPALKKNENPDNLRMNRDTAKENEKVDATEDVKENDTDAEEKSDPDSKDKERSNIVTM
jgi:hypothetical protein